MKKFLLLVFFMNTASLSMHKYTSPYTTKIAEAIASSYEDMIKMRNYRDGTNNDSFLEYVKNSFNFTGNISDISTFTIETVQYARIKEGYWWQFRESIIIRVLTKFLFKIFERILEYFAISFEKIPIYEVLKKVKSKNFQVFLNEKEELMWEKIKKLMRIKFPKGEKPIILLYGEPGVGKTVLIRNLLHSLPEKNKIIYIHASNIFAVDENKNISIAELNKVIDMLMKNPDYILVIDDVEMILMARYYFRQSHKNDIEKEFAEEFGDVLRTISTLVLFIFSRRETRTILISNLPNIDNIDTAISRRINYFTYISLPELETRRNIWLYKIHKYKIRIINAETYEAADLLARISESFSLRDIDSVCRNFKKSKINIEEVLDFIKYYKTRLMGLKIHSTDMMNLLKKYSI